MKNLLYVFEFSYLRKLFKNKILTLIALTLFLFQQYSCDTTEPPPIKSVKDPRTYTWTIDTLINNSFQTAMRRIRGSAPNDVYIGGHNAGFPGALWHFDGDRWMPVDLPVTTHDVNGIYGSHQMMFG